MAGRTPVVGQWYCVDCPTCFSSVSFECTSVATYGVKCSSCGTMIDLREPAVPLGSHDFGRPAANDSIADVEVQYSPDVTESDGLSAGTQVRILMNSMEQEKRKTMPTKMSGETTQAFSAQRNQAMADRLSFFHPITHAIERVAFGNKPEAQIGNVRIFRKRIPFKGWVYVPVPKTTTSYAAPTVITFSLYMGFTWFVHVLDEEWAWNRLFYEHFLVFAFYVLMYRLAYSDPGYIRPGYVDNDNRLSDELTLKDIESNQRESKWETINGVPMERKWCSTCEMYRPVRAAHCYLCGLCCLDHDHHCSVIGVCVGRRRVEMFTLFVNITCIALLSPTLAVLQGWYYSGHKLSTNAWYGSALLFIGLAFFSIIITLTAVSMTQSLTGEATTRERLQNVYANKRNPFSRGFFGNLRYHLFERSVAPSLFDDAFVKACQMRFAKRELGAGKDVTCIN